MGDEAMETSAGYGELSPELSLLAACTLWPRSAARSRAIAAAAALQACLWRGSVSASGSAAEWALGDPRSGAALAGPLKSSALAWLVRCGANLPPAASPQCSPHGAPAHSLKPVRARICCMHLPAWRMDGGDAI